MGMEVHRPHACHVRAAHTAQRSPRPAARPAARHGAARSGGQAAALVPPRDVRVKAAAAEAYAGPAFGSMSPSPRALPMPRFSRADDSASRGLRRLLGLE